MEHDTLTNPAEPAVDDGSYAGYAQIARTLSAMEPGRSRTYSRQLVQRWYTHRDYNGFPESEQVQTKSGKVKSLFKLDEVLRWHRSYRAHRRGHHTIEPLPPIDTIPLFQISDAGMPVC